MTSRLLAALEAAPLILDAAMGTRLLAKGLDLRVDDPCLWNLAHPDEVLEVHRRDVAAGSQVLFTNTFGANGFWLANYRTWLANCRSLRAVEVINRRAVGLAREAAGSERWVVGSIGPTAAEQSGAATEQAAVLVDAGVDALIFETYRAEAAERVLRELGTWLGGSRPLLVSLWEWPDPPEPAARRLLDRGAAVLGMNCQHGMGAALAFSQRLGPFVSCPLLVKPSASGAARPASGSSPASFAAAVPLLVDQNVRLLGGCCGTTEAHVAALAAACAPYQGIPRDSLTGASP
jgi:5-methyltetrahydrofolate--homocysteine methyltransferase